MERVGGHVNQIIHLADLLAFPAQVSEAQPATVPAPAIIPEVQPAARQFRTQILPARRRGRSARLSSLIPAAT